jgi:hypothetical protein
MFGISAVDVGNENAVAVFDFIVKAVVKVGVIVCYPPIRLAHALGRMAIFISDFFNKDREATSAACMNLRSCYMFRLALDFCFGAAGRTLWGTSRHLNLLHLPVNLGVVLAKPGEAEDHALLAQQGDCKLGSLCMAFVAQYDICDLGDSACFVRGSVDIVDWDRGGEMTGGDVAQADILSVDEQAGGTTVNECVCVALHRHVRHLNLDVDTERVFTGGRCNDNFVWQLTFPVGKANLRYFWEEVGGLGHNFRTFKYACSILTLIYY